MNPADLEQLDRAKKKYPEFFKDVRVLELGSRNINGSIRECFNNCSVTGVDWIAGPDVDIVCKFHEVDMPEGYYDVLISYSAFEHDPYWETSIKHNLKFLRSGGMVFFNWGGPKSATHGTEYDPSIVGEPTGATTGRADLTGDEPMGDYYPKSMTDMVSYLINQGVDLLESGAYDSGGCGEILWFTGRKL